MIISEEMSGWLGKVNTAKPPLTEPVSNPALHAAAATTEASDPLHLSSIPPPLGFPHILALLLHALTLHLHLALSVLICFLKAGL